MVFTKKKRKKSFLTEEEISQVNDIIITAPFEDHLHFNTLKEFSNANIWCSSQVKSILLKKNLRNKILNLHHQFNWKFELGLSAGFPYNTTAHCLHILNEHGFAVFHEGHVK